MEEVKTLNHGKNPWFLSFYIIILLTRQADEYAITTVQFLKRGLSMVKFLIMLVGSILVAVGINACIVPYHLLDGGIIGVGLIIKYTLGLNAGLTIIVFNFPIYFFAWRYYRSYFYDSIYGFLMTSILIDVLSPISDYITLSLATSAVLGGSLIGLGTGLMLRFKICTEGIDLLAQFISLKTSLNIGLLIFFMDLNILLLGNRLIGGNLFYSIVAITFVGLGTTLSTLTQKELV
ncbi:YitT family protein [Terrilactibacillus laevilacticus]|uniref:YitT family protein n=2 Tax=Terrilactibacillus laevilacticus TaxID=1380157 RepID=A0ABW5PSR6_9BACI